MLLLIGLVGLFLDRGFAPSPQPGALRPLVPLTSDPGREIDPAVSPDGSRVAYLGSSEAGYDIGWSAGGDSLFLLTPAAGLLRLQEYSLRQRRILPVDVPALRAAAMASDGKSLFAVTAAENKLLHIVSGKGIVHQLRLPSNAGLAALLTAPRSVYVVEEGLGTATVHRLDLETGATTTVRRLEYFGGGGIALAPDGRSLAFTRSRETANDLAWTRL